MAAMLETQTWPAEFLRRPVPLVALLGASSLHAAIAKQFGTVPMPEEEVDLLLLLLG
jgi:hypothetical protein